MAPLASGEYLDQPVLAPERVVYRLSMLVGRNEERTQIEAFFAGARAGTGGAVVLRGQPGIGKTALLKDAVEAAQDFRVLRALGVESEIELPFASLHELVLPVLDRIETLPAPQASALKVALALEVVEPADRFAASAATLGLLATVATDQPLLCVVDDAQWLDSASAEALAFVARRVEHDPIVMLFAVRDPDAASFSPGGLPELRIEGLPEAEARALLAARVPSLLPAEVETLVDTARGNPLALLEFASASSGLEPTADVLPVSTTVERAFVRRSAQLSPGAQRALLLAAASNRAEPEALWSALEAQGISTAVGEAEQAGLIVRGGTLEFAHPLARSAIYQAAPPAERRAAHGTLAETTRDGERRAWHLAAAASEPDETVAAALAQAADAARRRAGVSAEAAALERAAQLTPDDETRARRLLDAGLAAEAASRFERAEGLLAEAAECTADVELRAAAVARRSYLLFDRGEFDEALELATAEAAGVPGPTAARILTASGAVHALVHRLDIPAARATAERASKLAGPAASNDLDLSHMLAWTWQLSGDTARALELVVDSADRVDPGSILAIDFAGHFLFLEEYERSRQTFERIVKQARETQALGNLSYALDVLARLELQVGRPAPAYAAALESIQLIEPLGNDVGLASALAWLALVEAILGRKEDSREHGGRALRIAQDRGDRYNEVRARGALGCEALVRGDAAAAVDQLAPAAAMLAAGGVRLPNRFPLYGDLIEAQIRVGKREDAAQQVDRLLEDARLTGSRWAAAVGARGQALLATDADVREAFECALAASDGQELEHARTQLAYGERLRRVQERRAGRDQLHAALEGFDRLGARPWSDRARAELRASGERLRPRGPTVHEQLTPQELQVALAAADGLTNKEIGARLFLSPKTVDFHLGRAYRKLDIHSRRELIKLFAAETAGRERLRA